MERIRIILEFLKSELESKFEVKNATLQTSSQCLLGTVGDKVLFVMVKKKWRLNSQSFLRF